MKDLKGFKEWMVARGRDPDTADNYVADLLPMLQHPSGPLGRLRERNLSPNTLRRFKASLSAWAKYTDDEILKEKLSDFTLPPAERVTIQKPLTKEQWKALLNGIDNAVEHKPAIRCAIALMAIRGFRIGDVLRLKRTEVADALRTNIVTFYGKRRSITRWDVSNFRKYLATLLDKEGWETLAQLISPNSVKSPDKAAEKAVSMAFKKISKDLGFDPKEVHPHTLRRTYAVYYLEAVKGDLEKLRAHMNWKDIATAARYVDFADHEKLNAVATDMMKDMMK
jgi:integrase